MCHLTSIFANLLVCYSAEGDFGRENILYGSIILDNKQGNESRS